MLDFMQGIKLSDLDLVRLALALVLQETEEAAAFAEASLDKLHQFLHTDLVVLWSSIVVVLEELRNRVLDDPVLVAEWLGRFESGISGSDSRHCVCNDLSRFRSTGQDGSGKNKCIGVAR